MIVATTQMPGTGTPPNMAGPYRNSGVLVLPSGKTKSNVDAELVLHSVIEMQNYDKAIIVLGDGDCHCLVDYLIKQNKLLHLMIPNKYKYSSLLKKFADKIVFINNLKEKLEYKKR